MQGGARRLRPPFSVDPGRGALGPEPPKHVQERRELVPIGPRAFAVPRPAAQTEIAIGVPGEMHHGGFLVSADRKPTFRAAWRSRVAPRFGIERNVRPLDYWVSPREMP